MPLKWTPELDSILLHGVFEECNISFSKALCSKIAERVGAAGIECTPKAVENRLYSWKKKNVGGTINGSTPNTPSKPATPKTPASSRGRAKAATKKKIQAEQDLLHNDDDDEDEILSPTVNRKRGRSAQKPANYAESGASDDDVEEEYVPLAKKVKQEQQDADDFTNIIDNEVKEEV
ncbi:hypothetical protein P153DRAFT_432033 [Dothidotthia symphoricarpi CBS 119687]|uniref:Uncharacterized protein n=1 Tax=Dothidotthia symphoricarpi CBS 119687 TaxID=1392245 RepID=A0A6A6ABH4_9PLEO|nr:uncharacterized protein P153DRAFT_432033 [Dothidotthia symphoricarpi CBS 119687]KAF2128364.1 hypothetical protein P153DRAFT_432033 [Dothidotthia symphoricarpi CBS 119687]